MKPITEQDFENLVEPGMTEAEVAFKIHKQGIAILLQQAGEELPTLEKIKEEASRYGESVYKSTSDAQCEYSAREGFKKAAEWLKELAITIIAKLKDEKETLSFQKGVQLDRANKFEDERNKAQAEISELKLSCEKKDEEIARLEIRQSTMTDISNLLDCNEIIDSLKEDVIGFAEWLGKNYPNVRKEGNGRWWSTPLLSKKYDCGTTLDLLKKYEEHKALKK